jgi:diguanylate cyclase (GGDEF)-like protein
MIDIDHFKRINDTYGHLVGDGVLRHVASTMSQRMRTEDVFARYGGEEFIALLRGAELKAAHQMAERMRVAISTQPAFVQEHRIPVSVSAGCAALACTPEPSPESLIAIADERLYAAKRAGRNRVVSAD